MSLASMMIGAHIWFFREGDAFTQPAPGVCAQEAKPGITPNFDAAWIDAGVIEMVEPTAAQQEYKLWKPAPGRLVLKDLLENQQELSFKATGNDVSAFAIENFFRVSQKLDDNAVTQFNPLSSISKKGWVHFQFYDHRDVNVLNLDVWCRIRTAMKFDGAPTKPEFELYQLYSSLNTGAYKSAGL